MEFDARQTLIFAILTLFIGKFLNRRIAFLRAYNLPEPVTGGVLVSLLFGLLYFVFNFEPTFTVNARDGLLIVFFTTIGLNAKFGTLLAGGRPLLILLAAAVAYLIIQNLTGVATTMITGQPSALGILGGSISLSGGHGTAIAWAPKLTENFGLQGASEIGIACATFGLVLGGVVGGPLANYLIKKHKLSPAPQNDDHIVGLP
ncbi:MAG: sodium/glutamate symporter, partial [Verrucomicrobiales bacterium]|nr:sodium/glutamate symporter [Verrucomicrobiales bacterium]